MSTTCPSCGAAVHDQQSTCQVCGTDVQAASSATGPTGTPAAPPPPPSSSSQSSTPPPTGTPPPATPGSAPHASGLPSDVRNLGMAAHLSSFLGAWVALAFVGPLVLWLVKRDDHPFIEHHAKEALNFNLSVLLYGAIAGVLSLLLIGLPFLIAIVVAWVILTIVAAVKAANGEGYRYPMTIRFVS